MSPKDSERIIRIRLKFEITSQYIHIFEKSIPFSEAKTPEKSPDEPLNWPRSPTSRPKPRKEELLLTSWSAFIKRFDYNN